VVDIVPKIDLAMGDNDYPLLGDIDLGNLEHQAQDSLDSLDTVRKVNIVDKRLLEAVNILVDQDEENVDEEPCLGRVKGWDLACW